ncbi:MAG TPA: carboxypeptidase regulatory-like domain-containing protein [Polyangia bacterium]|nr:carboxypeptidase regulatory-like domain-containing protein [Polyangia bacterium]
MSALGCVFAGGCGKSAPHPGGLFVTVKDPSMATVADAVVTTDPVTESIATDALGSALFRKVPPGFYSVTVVHPSFGAARAPVTVEPDVLAEITVTLRKDLSLDAGADGGAAGGGVGGRGAATGSGGAIGTGGSTGRPDGGDAAGPGDAGNIDPSLGVALAPLTKDSNGVNLAWTVTGTYTSYRIYRARDAGSFEVINILNAPPTLTYRDESPQLGASYRYRVGGLTAGGQEIQSNIQTITAGVFIEVGSQVERIRADPTRPYLYLLDRVNNSLHFVNLSNNTVATTIFVGSTPVDMGINLAGTELFIADFGASEIAVVDLATQMKTRSLLVDTAIGTWDGNPFRLTPTAGDTLVFTSEDQWNSLKLVTATTGASIVALGTIYEPAMAASPDGRRVYVGEFGLSSDNLIRFDVSGTTLTQVDTAVPLNGNNTREVLVTGDGTYVFYAGRKYLANNLKSLLGTFSEAILAVNHDGTVAIGPTKIFDGTTFSARKPLPLSTTVMALSADDKTLYLYDMMSSRIYLYSL